MIRDEWQEAVAEEFKKPYYRELYNFVTAEYASNTIYPPKERIFYALGLTGLSDTKVVILGQDPYHEENQAMGLSFSVPRSQRLIPPSLQNIYKELKDDIGIEPPSHGDLTAWAKQGVLLLNTVLTVQAHRANSHKDKGWEILTGALIDAVVRQNRPIVFMLWGKNAQAMENKLTNPKHLILKAPHPSPLSAHRGFLGCRHFSMANKFLKENGISEINWQIPE